MELDQDACYRALETRDPRFDGRFFTGVRSTGIYCRPICPARTPKRINCVFLPCAAAAREAGFRPCLRCRPESSPGTPAWSGTSSTVTRGLRLIDAGALDDGGVAQLAHKLGVGERHLRRLFAEHIGASPQAIAQTRRVSFAKKLIDETDLRMADIAFSAGFSSLRRFNDAMRNAYRRAPRELRRARAQNRAPRESAHTPTATGPLSLRLSYRPPLDWQLMLSILSRQSIPGVSQVDGNAYIRTFRLSAEADETVGRVKVEPAARGHQLRVELELSQPWGLIRIVERLRRLFDLHADPEEIRAALGRDACLAAILEERPGVRIPGAWDPFEFAVTRLVLGARARPRARQQLCDLVGRWGRPLDLPGASNAGASPNSSDPPVCDWPGRLFPTADELAGAPLGSLGLSDERARALTSLCSAVASGDLDLDAYDPATGDNAASALGGLFDLPGVRGDATQLIALHGLGEPDAFPSADPALRRALDGFGEALSREELETRAERWRPWRGYAAVLLWESLS